MKKNVICLGNISFDLIHSFDQKKRGLYFDPQPGGSVRNTAVILKKLGIPVSLVSQTSDDFLGKSLIELLSKDGIGTKYIFRNPSIRTPIALAQLDKKGNSSYVFYENVDADFPKNIPSSLFDEAASFHTGSMFSYKDDTYDITLKYLLEADKKGLFITYDPNWRPARVKDKKTALSRIKSFIRYVSLLKLNEYELLEISGRPSERSALSFFSSRCEGTIVVTCGEKGSYCFDGEKKIFCPALPVKVADTIGAGDAFTAGLIYKYLSLGKDAFDASKKENLKFASGVAALVCTKHGASDGLKNIGQVDRFVSQKM